MEFTQTHAEAITKAFRRIEAGEVAFKYEAIPNELEIEAIEGTLYFGVHDTPNSPAVAAALEHARTLGNVDYESGVFVSWVSLAPERTP